MFDTVPVPAGTRAFTFSIVLGSTGEAWVRTGYSSHASNRDATKSGSFLITFLCFVTGDMSHVTQGQCPSSVLFFFLACCLPN